MKRGKLVIFLIFLSMFLYLMNGYSTAQPSEEQFTAFRSAKTVRIIVNQFYGEAKGVSLPFEYVAGRLLQKYARLKVVKADAKNYDVTLSIEAKGEAKSSERYPTNYSGASLSGTISLEIPNIPVYKKSFYGYETPAKFHISGYSTPSSAPFDRAFSKSGSFLSQILEMMGEVYGHPCIISALKDDDLDVRIRAVEIIGKLKEPSAVKPLIKALQKDDKIYVKKAIAEALGEIGDPRAVQPLIVYLKNCTGSAEAEVVVSALGKIGDPRAVGALIGASREWTAQHLDEAVSEALVQIGEPAVESLIAALKSDSFVVRRKASEALGRIGDTRAVEPLIILFDDDSASVVESAIIALGEIGDPKAVEPLAKLLERLGVWRCRLEIPLALAKIGYQRAVEVLIKALDSHDDKVQQMVKECLGRIRNPSGIKYLISILTDKESPHIGTVAEALGEIKEITAVEPLISILMDKESPIRETAAKALGKIKDIRAVEPLLASLQDTNSSYLKKTIIIALGEIKDKRAVEPLIEIACNAFENNDEDLMGDAGIALGKIGDPRAVEPFLAKCKDERSEIRRRAAYILKCIANPIAVNPLIELLKDDNLFVRYEAADALSFIGQPAVEQLINALKNKEIRIIGVYPSFYGKINDFDARWAFFHDVTFGILSEIADNYKELILKGEAGTEWTLVGALNNYGDKEMAEVYLNCGNKILESAASDWAKSHGYDVMTFPTIGYGIRWGGKK